MHALSPDWPPVVGRSVGWWVAGSGQGEDPEAEHGGTDQEGDLHHEDDQAQVGHRKHLSMAEKQRR